MCCIVVKNYIGVCVCIVIIITIARYKSEISVLAIYHVSYLLDPFHIYCVDYDLYLCFIVQVWCCQVVQFLNFTCFTHLSVGVF